MNEDYKLIELVRGCDFLYDKKSPYYKDLHRKINAWKHIGDILGDSAEAVEKRWIYLRNRYTIERKRICNNPEASTSRPTMLYEALSFLDTYVPTRRSSTIYKEYRQNYSTDEVLTNDIKQESQEYESNMIFVPIPELDNPSTSSSSTPMTSTPLLNNRFSQQTQRGKKDEQNKADSVKSCLSFFEKYIEADKLDDENDCFAKMVGKLIKKVPEEFIDDARIEVLQVLKKYKEKELKFDS